MPANFQAPEYLQQLHEIHDKSPGVFSLLGQALDDSQMEREEVVEADSREHDVLDKVEEKIHKQKFRQETLNHKIHIKITKLQ